MTTSATKGGKKSEQKTLVLLDAHAILHRAFHALPDFTTPKGEPSGALYGVVTMLLRIIEDFKPDYLAACYDLPEPTYRHTAFAGYKGKREKTDEGLIAQIERSRSLLEAFGIPIYEHPGFEADDALGTIAHQLAEEKNVRVIIASGDMDTLQCVQGKRVVVYTLKKGVKDTILYDEAAVKERFGFPPRLIPDYKGLRGDTSDNIPGIVGIGEKTATELLTQFGDLDSLYKKLKKGDKAFIKAGIKPRIVELLKNSEEEARFSKMLATIRTDAPINFDLQKAAWRTHADPTAVLALFTALGFRSLTGRAKTLFAVKDGEAAAVATATAGTDPALVRRAAVLLWLLESERTNASLEDITEYGRAFFETVELPEIIKKLEEKLRAAGLWSLFTDIEEPLMTVLAHMEQNGILLDTDYLKTLSVTMHQELEDLEVVIYGQAGLVFNLNSPKQLGDVLFDGLGLKPKNQKKTAGGQRSTKESELEKLRREHPIIEYILRYRELQKLVSTYVDNLPGFVAKDGRLHTTFIQTGAATGRMATQNPGLQNIPVRTAESRAIRQAFVASPGYRLVCIDYSQIELRIAAILSEDKSLIDIFRRGEDVHTGVAVRVFKVDAGAVTREMRRKAKVINFGILYGMGVVALRQNLGEGTSREEAQAFLNAYFHTFTRLAEYLEETKAYARKHGYTETLFGRRRQFPGITSSQPFIRASAERMAINAPVQGTAADIMRLAMNEVYAHLAKAGKTNVVRMLLQVHDELVFEIKEEALADEIPTLVAIMENILHDKENHGVPLRVSVATGPNWGELTESKF
jgi:DNA polymerase-1